jgi:hypothetical protein
MPQWNTGKFTPVLRINELELSCGVLQFKAVPQVNSSPYKPLIFGQNVSIYISNYKINKDDLD